MVQQNSAKIQHSIKGNASVFQILILVLFTLLTLSLILYFTVFKVRPAVEYTSWKTGCTESVKTHSLFAFGDLAARPRINCPPLDVTINDDLQEQVGQDHAKSQIAHLMKECWDIYGKGKLKLFSKEAIYCSPCSIISFENKKEPISKFTEYLRLTKAPGQDVSYLDYFASVETTRFRDLINDPKIYNAQDAKIAGDLDPTKQYGVVFTYVRGTRAMEEWANAIDSNPTVVSGGLGALSGAAGAAVAVVLIGTPIGWGIGIVSVVAVSAGGISAAVDFFKDKPDAWIATISLVEWKPDALKNLQCKEVPIGVDKP